MSLLLLFGGTPYEGLKRAELKIRNEDDTDWYHFGREGLLDLLEASKDPANPPEGRAVMWMSDGTGSGDDGDIMVKVTAGGTTKTITLIDFSAF